MNRWSIKTSNGKEFELMQKGFAFFMAEKGKEFINPFFCDSEVAKALFNDDSKFLKTLGSMNIATEDGTTIEIEIL